MKIKINLSVVFLSLFMVACNQAENVDTIIGGEDELRIKLEPKEAISISYSDNNELTDTEALNILNEFVHFSVSPESRSASKTFKILNEEFVTVATSKTRAMDKIEKVKFVNIEVDNTDGNQNGFAVVCADQRYPNVVAFIDKGNIEDINENGGGMMLKLSKKAAISQIKAINDIKDSLELSTKEKICNFLRKPVAQFSADDLKYIYIDDVESRGSAVQNPSGTCVASVGPLTQTTWIQGWPCNEYILEAPDDSQWNQTQHRKHYPAGCTVVAMAHIASYYKPTIPITEPGYNRNIDWSTALAAKDLSHNPLTTTTATKEVALLMKSIANGCHTTFSEKGGETSDPNTVSYMNSIGIQMGGRTDLTYQNIRYSLSDLKLVYATGQSRTVTRSEYLSGSHAWVVDGYKLIQRSLARQELKQYNVYCHCNFGWIYQENNGWYLFDYNGTISFDVNWGSEIYDVNLKCYPNITKYR